jgi:uncharacterized protein YqgC (DUF456 family)
MDFLRTFADKVTVIALAAGALAGAIIGFVSAGSGWATIGAVVGVVVGFLKPRIAFLS